MIQASLAGQTVLIPRAKAQTEEMAEAVRMRGGNPFILPLLQIVPITNQFSAENLSEYDWILFTSKNSVIHFFQLIGKKDLPHTLQVAAIGTKTKQALVNRGCKVAFVPSKFEAEAFVEEFLSLISNEARILFPKGNLARDVIPTAMQEAGFSLHEMIVYETKYNEDAKLPLIKALESGSIDIITFTSPSTVKSFVNLLEGTNWRQWVKRCTIGCIGPTTEREARNYFTSIIMPQEYTIGALLDCASSQTR